MLKTTFLVVFAFSAGVGSTALWAKWEPRAPLAQATASAMPSIDELHLRANARNLPDQTVKESF
jgi:hypothetical protein